MDLRRPVPAHRGHPGDAVTPGNRPEVEHHVRLAYVMICDVCGSLGEVETVGDGSRLAEEHEGKGRP